MKFCIVLLVAAFVIAECSHTFMGTSVMRQLVYHTEVKYSANMFSKRIENFNYTIPVSYGYGRTIQGILCYDVINRGASVNVTSGGLGYSYVSLRMKSEQRQALRYEIYIFA